MQPDLRQLVDLQQFEELNEQAQSAWQTTHAFQALALHALACAHLKDFQHAFALCEQCESQLDKMDLDARVDLAGAYCLLWKVDEAVELLEVALTQSPEDSLAMARLAWCRWQQNDIKSAIQLYQDSSKSNAQRIPVWSGLTRLLLEEKQSDQAQYFLNQGLNALANTQAQMPNDAIDGFKQQFEELQLGIWVVQADFAQAEEWLSKQTELALDDWSDKVALYALILAQHNYHNQAEEVLKDALKHAPEQQNLILQWAAIAGIQGDSLQESRLLKRAIKLAEKHNKPTAALWVRLSSCYLHQDDLKAQKAAEKAQAVADTLEPNDDLSERELQQLNLQVKTAMAQVHSQLQAFTEAEILFKEVLEENPYLVNALQGFGSQQMQLGKLDEAIELFERLKQVDPMQGVSALINARQFPEDDDTLLKMEKWAKKPTLEGNMRSGILFQLAFAWEKRKDFDKAFSLVDQANQASRQHLNYDPQQHRQSCARIRHAFSADLYAHRGHYGSDSSLPVFVLGMPRSGTTLVEQIIASHSKIFGAGELGVIPQRIQGLNRWERHTGSGRSYPDVIDDLTPEVTTGIANEILQELKAYAPEAKHIVDKLPHNFENIGLIKFLFPNARIISVRRDPRDIAISNYFQNFQAKHGGMGFAYDLEWIGQQLADHNLLMHHWMTLFPNQILEVNYEDVVENTEHEARRLLDYIGVDWEEQVLAFNQLDRPVKTASVWQVRQPIYKTAKEKWRNYEAYLAPLIKGTNAKIKWQPIDDMITLPEPGMLHKAMQFFENNQASDAEYEFKKTLHHIPNHATANAMIGIIYARNNLLKDALPFMEKAQKNAPWNRHWRKNLIQAYDMLNMPEKANTLKQHPV